MSDEKLYMTLCGSEGIMHHASGLVWSGLVWSGLVWSGLVWSGVRSGPVRSDPVRSGPVRSSQEESEEYLCTTTNRPNNHPNIEQSRLLLLDREVKGGNLEFFNLI